MVDKDRLRNNKNIHKQAEENVNKMQKDENKFCLELGWGCWIDGQEVAPDKSKKKI